MSLLRIQVYSIPSAAVSMTSTGKIHEQYSKTKTDLMNLNKKH